MRWFRHSCGHRGTERDPELRELRKSWPCTRCHRQRRIGIALHESQKRDLPTLRDGSQGDLALVQREKGVAGFEEMLAFVTAQPSATEKEKVLYRHLVDEALLSTTPDHWLVRLDNQPNGGTWGLLYLLERTGGRRCAMTDLPCTELRVALEERYGPYIERERTKAYGDNVDYVGFYPEQLDWIAGKAPPFEDEEAEFSIYEYLRPLVPFYEREYQEPE